MNKGAARPFGVGFAERAAPLFYTLFYFMILNQKNINLYIFEHEEMHIWQIMFNLKVIFENYHLTAQLHIC